MPYMHKTVPSRSEGVMTCWMTDHGRANDKTWHRTKRLTNASLGSSKALGGDAQPVVCRNLDQAVNRSTCIAKAPTYCLRRSEQRQDSVPHACTQHGKMLSTHAVSITHTHTHTPTHPRTHTWLQGHSCCEMLCLLRMLANNQCAGT